LELSEELTVHHRKGKLLRNVTQELGIECILCSDLGSGKWIRNLGKPET